VADKSTRAYVLSFKDAQYLSVLSPVIIMPPYDKYHPGGLHAPYKWKLAERQGRELERTSERLTYIRSNVFLPAGMTHDECTACCEFISPNMYVCSTYIWEQACEGYQRLLHSCPPAETTKRTRALSAMLLDTGPVLKLSESSSCLWAPHQEGPASVVLRANWLRYPQKCVCNTCVDLIILLAV